MRRVVLYAQNMGFASTIVGPLEVFAYTGSMWNFLVGTPFDMQFLISVVSYDGKPVTTRTGLVIQVDGSIHDVDKADIVLVTSCGEDIQSALSRSRTVIPLLKKFYDDGAIVGSICSGLALLAATGLLNGKKATTHWGMVEIFRKQFPKIQLESDQLYIDEGRIVTSGGGYAGNDLALHLVEQLCGNALAKQVANALLLDTKRESQSSYAGVLHHRMHKDERIQKIQTWLDDHFNEVILLDDLAMRYGMSPRNFKRRFKEASGETPLSYLQKLRTEAAKSLLESTTQPIDAIAERVGYKDENYFRRLFKRHTHVTPNAYRVRFGST